jgi:hypothetical protein
VEALTPALRVDCDYRDDRQRNLLAGFVRAIRNAFKELRRFYESPDPIRDPCGYRSNSNNRRHIDRPFPYRDYYTDESNRDITHPFKYISRLMQGALLFLAERTEPQANATPIVVKFTRTYSTDVHKLLASGGFAPELYAVEGLAGGWKMVVMEYLSGYGMLGMIAHEERLEFKEKLQQALGVIHGRNLVHGDVRGPNILVFKDDIKLIDFDHCGTEGVTRYPREWDHTLRRDDMMEGDVMQRDHDNWMLERIFDRSSSSPGRNLGS